MEESLYTKALLSTAGVALIQFVEWCVFRNKSTAFRIRYHPLMTPLGAFLFGILGVLVIFDKNSTALDAGLFVVGSMAVGIVDIIKRQICSNCGFEANVFAINGLFTRCEHCPKCGYSYKSIDSK